MRKFLILLFYLFITGFLSAQNITIQPYVNPVPSIALEEPIILKSKPTAQQEGHSF